MSITFTGTSIRLYCALANEVNLNPRATHLVFYLDNSAAPVSTFDHEPTADIGYVYNQLVYDSGALPLGKHTVLASNVATADVGSLVLLDYAVYSTEVEEDDTTATSHSSTSPVSAPSTSSLSISMTGSSTRDPQSHTLVSSAPPSASSTSPTASGTQLVPPASASTQNMAGGDTRSGMSVGAIVGTVVSGGVAALLVVCAALWYYTRRLRRSTEPVADIDDPNATVTPYTDPSHAPLEGPSPQHITPISNWKRKTSPVNISIPPSNVSSSSPRSDADLGSEVARMRVELERLRRIADHDTPPRYEDGSV